MLVGERRQPATLVLAQISPSPRHLAGLVNPDQAIAPTHDAHQLALWQRTMALNTSPKGLSLHASLSHRNTTC